jgi:hypothetical protein
VQLVKPRQLLKLAPVITPVLGDIHNELLSAVELNQESDQTGGVALALERKYNVQVALRQRPDVYKFDPAAYATATR